MVWVVGGGAVCGIWCVVIVMVDRFGCVYAGCTTEVFMLYMDGYNTSNCLHWASISGQTSNVVASMPQ